MITRVRLAFLSKDVFYEMQESYLQAIVHILGTQAIVNGQDIKPGVSTSTSTDNTMNIKPTTDLAKTDVVLNKANSATGIVSFLPCVFYLK